jgi:hypothetical protein
VSFFLNHNRSRHDNSGNSGFLTIADNGSGMDQKTIEQFATYSLDKATRGIMPEYSKQTNIGKFGVGAKQAAFYFGDRVRVITKCKKSEKVMEFSLDRNEFEERHKNNEDVYKDEIKVRSLGDDSLVPRDERAIGVMQDVLNEHEMKHENFTILVIRLHPKIVKQMLHDDKYRDLPNELAEIYHYHLHPEHTISEITKIPKFKDAGGKNVGRHSTSKKDDVPLDIICSMWLTENDVFKPHQDPEFSVSLMSPELTDPVQKCIEKVCIYRCYVYVYTIHIQYIYMYIYMYFYICIYIYVYRYTDCVQKCIEKVCIYMYICIHIYVDMYKYIYI